MKTFSESLVFTSIIYISKSASDKNPKYELVCSGTPRRRFCTNKYPATLAAYFVMSPILISIDSVFPLIKPDLFLL